jgi:transposase
VLDVATTATSRVRELSRGGRRKNDVIDASAAASVAALQGDTSVVLAEDAMVFALLEERRANLAAQRVPVVNQLHALLRDLVPGGARTDLSATAAAAILRSVRPASPVEHTRKDLARDQVREIRGLDTRLTAIAARMTVALDDYGSRLVEVVGIGPVLGVRLIGRTGQASTFPSPGAFASYAAAAPIEVSSGENSRHRLSRSGD